jgi:hypothetical protein
MVHAMTIAASGVITSLNVDAVAVPSCSMNNGTLVINADQSVVDTAISNGTLYGAYGNIITKEGVSAMWDGAITGVSSSTKVNKFGATHIVNDGTTAIMLQPDNMINKPNKVIFYEAGTKNSSLNETDAVAKLAEITYASDAKTELIKEILKGVKCSVAGNAKDCI